MLTRHAIGRMIFLFLLITMSVPSAHAGSPSKSDQLTQSLHAALATSHPEMARTSNRAKVAYPCYGGAKPATRNPRCVAIIVQGIRGHVQHGIPLTMKVNGTEIRRQTGPILGLGFGYEGVAVDMSRYGGDLGDVVSIETQQSGPKQTTYIAINPDPKTLTQYETITLEKPVKQPTIMGHVYQLNSKIALEGATVELWNHAVDPAVKLGHTTTIPHEDEAAFYRFDDINLPTGTPLELRASWLDPDDPIVKPYTQTVQFVWQNQFTKIPIVFGVPCGGSTPRGGEGKGLPGFYCLTVYGNMHGGPTSDVEVSVVVSDTILIEETKVTDKHATPVALFDIGPEMYGLSPTTVVTLSAFLAEHNMLGVYTTTLGSLYMQGPWHAKVVINLLDVYLVGEGFTGGSASTALRLGTTLYVGSRYGGILAQYDTTGSFKRLLGRSHTLLGDSSITALTGWHESGVDVLVTGTRDTGLWMSPDGGNRWYHVTSPFPLRAIRQLVATDARTIYGVSEQFVFRMTFDDQLNSQIEILWTADVPLFGVTLLDNTLYLATPEGIQTWNMVTGDTTQLTTDPAYAISSFQSRTGVPRLLVATETGLVQMGLDGRSQTAIPINSHVLALAPVAGDSSGVVATTTAGVFSTKILESTPPHWISHVFSESTIPYPLPDGMSLGVSTIYDFTRTPDGIIAASSQGVRRSQPSTGTVTVYEGQQWHPLGHLPSLPVRSVAVADQEVFALTPTGVWAYMPDMETWEQRLTLPVSANAMVMRASPTGTLLVGHAAAAQQVLHRSTDGGQSWEQLDLAAPSGVTTLAWGHDTGGREVAFIGTDADGVFMLDSSKTITPLPLLPNESRRISALAVDMIEGCTVIAATLTPVELFSRPCDATGSWTTLAPLPLGGDANTTMVTSITIADTSTRIVSTNNGVFLGSLSDSWSRLNVPAIPMTIIPGQAMPHHLIIGTFGGGVLVLNDMSPDIVLRVDGPESARGGEEITYTATVTNLRTRPVTTTLHVDLPSDITLIEGTVITPVTLGARATSTLTYRVRVKEDVKPTYVTLTFDLDPVPGELYQANNTKQMDLELVYRDAPDPRVLVTGKFEANPGESAMLTVAVINDGTQPDSGSTLTLNVPEQVRVGTPSLAPQSTDETMLIWDISSLEVGENVVITIPYSFTESLDISSVPVVAMIVPNDDDRELANNAMTVYLRHSPTDPQIVHVSDLTALSTYGSTTLFHQALAADTQRMSAINLILDHEGPCVEGDGERYRCKREVVDRALVRLTATKEGTQAWEQALKAFRRAYDDLVAEIESEIKAILIRYPSIKYIYFHGDDSIIPGAVFYIDAKQDALIDETDYLPEIQTRDILYGVVANNGYITDVPYEQVLPHRLISSGRFVGTPDDIARVILSLSDLDSSTLVIQQGMVSGVAEGLTEDVQTEVCQTNASYFIEPTPCETINTSVRAFREHMVILSTLIGLSGHGTVDSVGNLEGRDLQTTTFESSHIFVTLACHTGLATLHTDRRNPAFMIALHQEQQFGYGFTSYVLAGGASGSKPIMSYAEDIYLSLMHVLQARYQDITLGDALRQARESYYQKNHTYGKHNKKENLINTQTMYALRLYGPPDLRISQIAPDLNQRSAMPVIWDDETITITPSWQAETTDHGTIYLAEVKGWETTLLSAIGHTLQSAVRIPVSSDVTGVRLTHTRYRDQPQTDPVIPQIGRLSTPTLGGEPAYEGGPHDWFHHIRIYDDSTGQRYVEIGLGEWHQHHQTQRLYESITIQFKQGTSHHPPYEVDWNVTTCRTEQGAVQINVIGAKHMESLETVFNANGETISIPLEAHGNRWEGLLYRTDIDSFALQGLTREGALVMDTNGDQGYHISATPCR